MLRDKLRRMLRNDGGDLKIILVSLLLAFSIWLVYNLTLNYTKVVSVPIVARSNISGYRQQSAGSSTVLARCHTRGFDLIRLGRKSEDKPMVVDFDASDFRSSGDGLFYLTSSELQKYTKAIFGDKAGMESFVTDTLYFRFQHENSKVVAVSPVANISFEAQHMSPSGLRLHPDSVTVYGEPAFLDKIDRVYTRSFSLEDLKSAAHGEVRLEGIKGVRMSDESVEYAVDVVRYVDLSARLDLEVRNVPAGRTLYVYPHQADVVIRSEFPPVGNPAEKLVIYIDYEDFAKSRTGECIARFSEFPVGVISCSSEPEVFECMESDR